MDITWAVIDSGIDGHHPHFKYNTLDGEVATLHRDFTRRRAGVPLSDVYGHGTHVAGIIAGGLSVDATRVVASSTSDETGDGRVQLRTVADPERLSGVAPRCKLVSLKVLDDEGRRPVERRHAGARLRPREAQRRRQADADPRRQPERRLRVRRRDVRLRPEPALRRGRPAGADRAWWWWSRRATPATARSVARISGARTPGLSHHDQRPGQRRARDHRRLDPPRRAAHLRRLLLLVEGADRRRPAQARPGRARRADHVVRGRRQAARHASSSARRRSPSVAAYVDDSGTSMAAPHVSGAIAAFLSIRREFIGQPEEVKRIFLDERHRRSAASATSRDTAWSI